MAPLTYPLLVVQTLWVLARLRPPAVIVVAPPFVAPLAALLSARIQGIAVGIDIHSGALLDRRWRWSVPLLAWAARHAAINLVTVPTLRNQLGPRVETLVLPDPLPHLTARRRAGRSDGRSLVVGVCGWGSDEPVAELIEAARGREWELRLTGDPGRSIEELPPNARLTGFLKDDAYAQLLAEASVVVVLTRRDQTLLSGAWEALALGRPLVVSSTPTLVAAFGPTIARAGETSLSIRQGIEAALADEGSAARSAQLAVRFRRENARALADLRARLASRNTGEAG